MQQILNKIKKKINNYSNKKKIFFLIIIFIVLWSIILLYDVRYAKIIIPIKIKFEVVQKYNLLNLYRDIDVYNMSPKNKITSLKNPITSFKKEKNIWENKYFYSKNIYIKIPENVFNNITRINILFGKKEYSFTYDIIKSNWERINFNQLKLPYEVYDKNTNYIIFEMPAELKGKKTIIPFNYFKNIINWKGDFWVLIITFFKSLFFSILIIIIIKIIFFLIKYKIKKSDIILIVASIFFTIILCEIFARIWLYCLSTEEQFNQYALYTEIKPEKLKYIPHHFLNYYLNPKYRNGNTYHNSLSYRNKEFPRKKPIGNYRIAILGGSTTYCSEVYDNEKTFTYQLENILKNKYRYKNIEVINAGVPGYNSWQSLINLEFRVLDIEPDLVIIYHNVNDIHARAVEPTSYIGDCSGRYKQWNNPKISIIDYSCLYRIIARKFGFKFSAGLDDFVNAKTYYNYNKTLPVELLKNNPPIYFERNLTNMIAISKINNIKIILSTWAYCPNKFDYASTEFYQVGFKEMNETIIKIAINQKIPFFDFAKVMSIDEKYWADGRHENEEGALLKANLFAEYLNNSKIIINSK